MASAFVRRAGRAFRTCFSSSPLAASLFASLLFIPVHLLSAHSCSGAARFLIIGCALWASSCVPRSETASDVVRAVYAEPEDAARLSDRDYLALKACHGTRSERIEAINVMARTGEPAFVPLLEDRLLKEDDRFIQMAIVDALASIGTSRAARVVKRALAAHRNDRVGIEAAVCLHRMGDDTGIPYLIANLGREDNRELASLSHGALKRIFGADLPPSARKWARLYRSVKAGLETWSWGRERSGGVVVPSSEVARRYHSVEAREFWREDFE